MSASSAQVPKQLYGYSLQFTECVKALIDAPADAFISVEVFEDVGVQNPAENSTEAIQVKAGSGANPISDGALDLWKTFRNWIDQCNTLQWNPKWTTFTIYVNAKHKSKLCAQISEASNHESVQAALVAIRSRFIDGRTKKLKESLGGEVREQLAVVLDPLNDELLSIIVANFQCRFGNAAAYEDLLQRFKQFPIPDGIIENAMVYIVGWVKRTLDVALEAGQPAIISRRVFWHTLTTHFQKATQQPYLIRFAHEPSDEEIEAAKFRTYIKQLQFIEASVEDQIQAVTDYLSTKATVIEYLDLQLLNEESLTEFAGDLERRWKLQKLALEAENNTRTGAQSGKLLYARCLLQEVPLQGNRPPEYFTGGCYHELADKKKVGWHPEYVVLVEDK